MAADAIFELPVERFAAVFAVPKLGGIHRKVHYIFGTEAEIHALSAGEAAHKKRRDNHQDQRTGHLRHHQSIAEAMPPGAA